jgi:hypothetical protein
MANIPVCLDVMTPEARRLLGVPTVEVDAFPFKVGRGEFRRAAVLMGGLKRKMEQVFRTADFDEGEGPSSVFELPEKEQSRYVSREHFEIVKSKHGYELVDLGSSLGTIVDGELIGGKRTGGRAKLEDGSVIMVGSHHSGFIFRFRTK